jgi:hypothetical protein
MKHNDLESSVGSDQSDQQRRVAELSRQALEQSVAELPGSVVAGLAEARRVAVKSTRTNPAVVRWQFGNRYVWGMAASIVLVGVIWFLPSVNQLNGERLAIGDGPVAESQPEIHHQFATSEVVNAADALATAIELAKLDPESLAVVEDLEFLYWLSLDDQQDEDV